MSTQGEAGVEKPVAFHQYADFPPEIRINVIQQALLNLQSNETRLAPFACINMEWEAEVERETFGHTDGISLVVQDIPMFQSLCNRNKRRLNMIPRIDLSIGVPAQITFGDQQDPEYKPAVRQRISNLVYNAMKGMFEVLQGCKTSERAQTDGLVFTIFIVCNSAEPALDLSSFFPAGVGLSIDFTNLPKVNIIGVVGVEELESGTPCLSASSVLSLLSCVPNAGTLVLNCMSSTVEEAQGMVKIR